MTATTTTANGCYGDGSRWNAGPVHASCCVARKPCDTLRRALPPAVLAERYSRNEITRAKHLRMGVDRIGTPRGQP